MPTYTATAPTQVMGLKMKPEESINLSEEDAAPYLDDGLLELAKDGATSATASVPRARTAPKRK